MLGFAWLTLRQAQEALKNGRLEEAHRLLGQPAARDHQKAGELLGQLARSFVERGERSLRRDDSEAAWRDLLAAEQLQTIEAGIDRLRQALTRLGVAEVRAVLRTGEPRRAMEALARLRDRGARSPELQILEEATRSWTTAREQAVRGEFARALETVDRIRRVMHNSLPLLEEFRTSLEERQAQLPGLLARLHEATEAARGREVIEIAEQVLALAPEHPEARKARTRAWKAVEPVTVAMGGPRSEPEPPPPPVDPTFPTRFFLWVDGVGGYLVCLGGRVSLGQATPDAPVDVPMTADVSRVHATLSRDSEGYVLEAVRPIQVNGQTTTRALLKPNDRVTLGASCQLQFRQPVPVSATARLDLVSGHKLPLAVDGVLLMADTLLMGPGDQVHVPVPDLKKPIVLYRHKDGLGVRYGGMLMVNGTKLSADRAALGPQAHVIGDDVSFAIEPAGTGTRVGR